MELTLRDTKSSLSVSETVFGYNFNESLVHQVIVSYAAGARQGTRSQKTCSEVAGSSKKPWRQKGTGRARSGSVKSPIWRSGGITFAAKPQNYSQKLNKKMYRSALKGIFSELIRQNRLIIVEKFSIKEPKTKLLVKKLREIVLKNVLIITDELNKNIIFASRNLYKVSICDTKNINPISLVSFDNVLMTVSTIKKVEEMLA